MFTDEACDLNGQRYERDDIDDAKQPKKKPAGSGERSGRTELKNGAILDHDAHEENEGHDNQLRDLRPSS